MSFRWRMATVDSISTLDTAQSHHLYKVYDTTLYNVNGWGSAKYGTKSVPCLRVMATERYTFMTYNDSNVFLGSFTSQTVSATFVGAGFIQLAAVSRQHLAHVLFQRLWNGDLLDSPTSVDQEPTDILPNGFGLDQNYPNPFNPSTEIRFNLPTRSNIRLVVYNLAGEQVKILVDNSYGRACMLPTGTAPIRAMRRSPPVVFVSIGSRFVYANQEDGFDEIALGRQRQWRQTRTNDATNRHAKQKRPVAGRSCVKGT